MSKRQAQKARALSGVPVVDTRHWLSRAKAAEAIGIAPWRVTWLLAKQELDAVQDSVGRSGVSKDSVDRYAEWRRSTGRVRRALGAVGTFVVFVLNFLA